MLWTIFCALLLGLPAQIIDRSDLPPAPVDLKPEVDPQSHLAAWLQLQSSSQEIAALDTTALQERGILCLKLLNEGELSVARDCFGQILEPLRLVGSTEDVSAVLNNLGGVYQNLGKPEKARRHYNEALEIRRASGDREKEARTLNNLGSLARKVGHWQEALAHYGKAVEVELEVGGRDTEAKTRNNIAHAYLTLGDHDRALPYLEESLALRRELGNRRGEAITLNNLAFLYHQQGLPAKALAFRELSLELRRELGDRGGEARALLGMAQDHRALGRPRVALTFLEPALAHATAADNRPHRSRVLRERGELLLELGRLEEGIQDLRQALVLQREIYYRAEIISTLVALAGAENTRGRPREALDLVAEAMDLLDTLREEVGSPELRATFLASRRRAYELALESALELHRRTPKAGHDRTALDVAERARARALLDLLATSEIDPQQTVAPALRQRHDELEGRLRLLTGRQRSLARDRSKGSALDELERELVTTLAQLDQVEAQIHRAAPRDATLLRPRPIDTATMQSLLDADTSLVVFALGEARSYLWLITPNTVQSFELPPRARIEDEARRSHRALRTVEVGGVAWEQEGEALSRLVLGPVARHLTARRVAFVADGALHYVPFAALPLPDAKAGKRAPLLIERAEVVTLPSASALRELRRQQVREPRSSPRTPGAAARTLAILADPVFDPADPRLPSTTGPPQATPKTAQRSATGDPLPRLSASRREALDIAALLPSNEVWTALDTEAHRGAVLDDSLAEFRLLHFATHGFLDGQRPDLSGLMLSRFDAEGRPQEGFLSLRDIYSLRLRAKLVVLSGCRTALGKDLRGEGLVGLTHGFLHAGVPRVVASLWSVEDRATARLMAHFYRALLHDELSPAAALRDAQLQIRRERRWRDPYYWAGFILQGDWH